MPETLNANKNYIVEGRNWRVKIELDDDDMTMDTPDQMMEAATKAAEVYFGHLKNESFEILEKDISPMIGLVLAVCPETEYKEDKEVPWTFVDAAPALANAGHYKESQQVIDANMKMSKEIRDEFAQKTGCDYDEINQAVLKTLETISIIDPELEIDDNLLQGFSRFLVDHVRESKKLPMMFDKDEHALKAKEIFQKAEAKIRAEEEKLLKKEKKEKGKKNDNGKA